MANQSYTLWQSKQQEDDIEIEDGEANNEIGDLQEVTIVNCNNTIHSIAPNPSSTGRIICIIGLCCAILCLLGVIIGYNVPKRSIINNSEEYTNIPESSIEDKAALLMSNINRTNMKNYLTDMSGLSHSAILPYLELNFRTWGYHVKKTSFWVTLSQPDDSKPNKITVKLKNGQNTTLNEVTDPMKNFLPYVFYSGTGKLTSTVVYGNYGSDVDLRMLQKQISLQGKILIIRLSNKLHLAHVVRNAEQYGISGLIYYPDPEDFDGINLNIKTYPNGTGLPQDGIIWSNIKLAPGDPSTPNHASIMQSAPQLNLTMNKILVQPVSSASGKRIISILGGPEAPSEWRGKLGIKYNLGGEWNQTLQIQEFTMEINNVLVKSKITNLHAYLQAKDKTKVIHIGCHYDQWKPVDADNPGSGLAVFLELGRAFSKTFPNGVKRQILFSAWDAEEMGVIGSTEFSELYSSWLDSTGLAYLNIDQEFLQGKGGLEVQASPLIREVFKKAAELVPWPGQHISVLNTLLHNDFMFEYPEADSDSYSFLYNHGIPTLDLQVLGANMDRQYFLYHSQYDKLKTVTDFLDPDFNWTFLVASLNGISALILSESEIIPVSFFELASNITEGWGDIQIKYRKSLINNDPDFKRLLGSVDGELGILYETFRHLDRWYSSNVTQQDTLYRIEERLHKYMEINKHFLRPRIRKFSYINSTKTSNYFPMKPTIESDYLVIGPDPIDPDSVIYFPGLVQVIRQAQAKEISWDAVKQELFHVISSLASFRNFINL